MRDHLDKYFREAMAQHTGAIEARLASLLARGFVISEIRLSYDPIGRTRIIVRDVPDSEFWIETTDHSITVRGEPVT